MPNMKTFPAYQNEMFEEFITFINFIIKINVNGIEIKKFNI